MVKAIVDHCLEKVAGIAPLPTEGLRQTAGPEAAGGAVYRLGDHPVAIMDTDAGFACQVVAETAPEPVSEALKAWADGTEYVLVGQVPLTVRNEAGLYLFGRSSDGGYVQVHVTNLPDGQLGALVTRADQNAEAERVLRP